MCAASLSLALSAWLGAAPLLDIPTKQHAVLSTLPRLTSQVSHLCFHMLRGCVLSCADVCLCVCPCMCRCDHLDLDVLVYTNSHAEKEEDAPGGRQACADNVRSLFGRLTDLERQRAVINIDGGWGGGRGG